MMTFTETPDEPRVCSDCVGDAFMKAEIERDGEEAECSFCEHRGRTILIEDLADRVEAVFEEHFELTPTEPSPLEYVAIKEGDYEWYREGEPAAEIIAEILGVEQSVASALQQLLGARHDDFELATMGEETPFQEDAHYEARAADDSAFHERWQSFEVGLKTRARHFNSEAEAVLAALFSNVHDLSTWRGDPAVRLIGPGTDLEALWRGRVFQSDDRLEEALLDPERLVGSPASEHATAGRMNAWGVSVFYGATNAEIVKAEVRPPVGSRIVVGRFKLLRRLAVLDFERLESVYVKGSLFDASHTHNLERARFLARLAERIRRPVMPNDEGTEYLATQAMAEYLADRVKPALDGVMYKSAQGVADGCNIVLLNHAARVKEGPPPLAGASIGLQHFGFEDEDWPDYNVVTELPKRSEAEPEPTPTAPTDWVPDFSSLIALPAAAEGVPDFREATLELERDTLRVLHVRGVSVDALERPVRRFTYEPQRSRMGDRAADDDLDF